MKQTLQTPTQDGGFLFFWRQGGKEASKTWSPRWEDDGSRLPVWGRGEATCLAHPALLTEHCQRQDARERKEEGPCMRKPGRCWKLERGMLRASNGGGVRMVYKVLK